MLSGVRQFGPVVVTLGMLAALAGFARLNIATDGVEAFRARARAAIDAMPAAVGDWVGERHTLDDGARDLLKPNAEASLLYRNSKTGQEAYYSLVQVRKSRDMVGHSPTVCYPGNGWTITRQTPARWRAGEFDIPGVEYELERRTADGKLQAWTIRNFYIFPDGTFGATPADLDRVAEDYRRMAYGVGQVQLVTTSGLSRSARDEVFRALVGSEKSLEMIRVLRAGIPK